ncbi:MAG: extracellular solute-binding protein, partial [Clostridiales bacterium]|nr:extracellular solute-binding protein [Clostridiales bacterium]
MNFSAHQEMLKGLTTALPITEDQVTLTYFMGYETNALNYIEGGDLMNQQVWAWLRENTGVTIDLTVVDKTSQTDKFNLMIASGEYTDLLNIGDYTAGTEAAYDEDIIIDLGDYLET